MAHVTANVNLSQVVTRFPVGTTTGVGAILSKNGLETRRYRGGRVEETFAMGAACSEVFSGPRLAKVLRPALEHQQRALSLLEKGEAISPLSIHTSVGVPSALGPFLDALGEHLPWPEKEDWFVNLQIEGTTAVWAGVEVLMSLRQVQNPLEHRPLVAVAEKSYHGPKTTALGQPAQARWPGAPRTQGQVPYPRPLEDGDEQTILEDFLQRFDVFLSEHGSQTGVILFEPQWGSSNAGRVWPRRCLEEAVKRSKAAGLLVLCDEIMCGLGRHGRGCLFLSGAWGLEPDAVTFGKAIGAGVFPLSGVVMRRGSKALNVAGKGMSQSHTYAASSALALMSAREVLVELPSWFDHAHRMGQLVQEILGPHSDGKFMRLYGQGLMWGARFVGTDEALRQECFKVFRQACEEEGVSPYWVPDCALMLSPPMDVDEATLREGLQRLARCCERAKAVKARL